MITYERDNLALIGGAFHSEQLQDFAAYWIVSDEMPFTLYATVPAGIQIGSTAECRAAFFSPALTRLHTFGPGGDLQLRRDEYDFYWRFVGKWHLVPEGLEDSFEWQDFWIDQDVDVLISDEVPETALLWGEYDSGRAYWHENRVGKAHLDYPIEDTPPRVAASARKLRIQRQDLRAADHGALAAIWTTDLVSVGAQNA